MARISVLFAVLAISASALVGCGGKAPDQGGGSSASGTDQGSGSDNSGGSAAGDNGSAGAADPGSFWTTYGAGTTPDNSSLTASPTQACQ
jgi:hypothetical protein